MSFISIQKFNEKATTAKKIQNLCKIFAPIFFGVKKTLLKFFFKTPHSVFLKHRFLFYTVYCAGVVFGNFEKKTDLQCLIIFSG
jgi:hypothetical protein